MDDPIVQKKKKKYIQVNPKNNLNTFQNNISINSISSISRNQTFNLSVNISGVETFSNPKLSTVKESLSQQQKQEQFYENIEDAIKQKELSRIIKQFFKQIFSQAVKISIVYSKIKPILAIKYMANHKEKNYEFFSIKYLLKANKLFAQRQWKVVQQIFDKLYYRVSQTYTQLFKIGLKMSNLKRIQLYFKPYSEKNSLFYYQVNENDKQTINFILFDNNMRLVQFDNRQILKLNLSASQDQLFKNFLRFVQKNQQKQERFLDCFDQEEIESDQEDRKSRMIENKSIAEIQNKIRDILSSDYYKTYEQQLDQLDKKCNEMQNRKNHKQRDQLLKLMQEVKQMSTTLEQYLQTRKHIQLSLALMKQKKENITQKTYSNLLKKIIIADKQLKNRLPILARKQQIFQLLNKNNLIILEGQTGSGKSTQLPQMLCEYYGMFDKPNTRPVLITQPRRLATRTVAERVADQMQQKIGGFVDYVTSINNKASSEAKIIFKLDSIVLDELTTDPILSKYSCLVIDEAHQRTISIDVILGLIKRLLAQRNDFKVIVTSASMDIELFTKYFYKMPHKKVSGTLYPVQQIYKPMNGDDTLVKKIQRLLKTQIFQNDSNMVDKYKGDVLVFCTGVDQISSLCNIFQNYLNKRVFRVYALHGRLAIRQQKQIFYQTKQHKIIFATRIAQTSITINGVKVVVDPGIDRQLVYDQKSRTSSRKLMYISQSSAKQRKGRAGRTSHGFCFRMYSQNDMKKHFRINKIPQISNMALDTLVLRLKSLKIQNVISFPYIQSPTKEALNQSLDTMQMLGALNKNGQITIIGRLLLKLQIQPFLGRSIIEAILCSQILNDQSPKSYVSKHLKHISSSQINDMRKIVSEVIKVLSMIINASNLFYSPLHLRQKLQKAKYQTFQDQRGDFFYLKKIYQQYLKSKKQGKVYLNRWLKDHFLTLKALTQAQQLQTQVLSTLRNFRIDLQDKQIMAQVESIKLKMQYTKNLDELVMSCMITSFCINLCLYSGDPNIGYTLITQKKPINLYGTSILSLLSKYPKWIICFDLISNDKGYNFCTIAQEIQFQILRLSVNNAIFKRLKLTDADKFNPYYKKISKRMPTSVIDEIKNNFRNRESDRQYEFFKLMYLNIKQEINTIEISYSLGLTITDINSFDIHFNPKETIQERINNYLSGKIDQKSKFGLRYNYISNIFVEIQHGFSITNISFNYMEIQINIRGQQYVLENLRRIYENQDIFYINGILKILVHNKQKEKIITENLSSWKQMIYFDISRREKAQKLPNAKIYMHFYTGTNNKPIYLYYRNNEEKSVQMHNLLQKACLQERKIKSQNSKYLQILKKCKFVLTKKKNGINCLTKEYDSFEISESLRNLSIFGILSNQFTLPFHINQFRQQNLVYQSYTEQDWENEIKKAFSKNKIFGVDVKMGRIQNNRKNFQLAAQISTNNLQILNYIQNNFDGKRGFLGSDKVHFRFNFRQNIIKVNVRAFKALEQLYKYRKSFLQNTNAQLKIQQSFSRHGKVHFVYIKCRSSIREQLLEPLASIKEIFTPSLIRLSLGQFNFLNNSDKGNAILDEIQNDYHYKIYFSFDRNTKSLKVYCEDDQFNQISQKLLKMIQKQKYLLEYIEYKGKNLNKIIDVIKNKREFLAKQKEQNRYLSYQIIFKNKQVQITADKITLEEVRNQIMKLTNQQSGSCILCQKKLDQPYLLINCDHIFCRNCLSIYLNQLRRDQKKIDVVQCPNQLCKKPFNIHDIKQILSLEQFESFCGQMIYKFVQKDQRYFVCYTSNCQQFFQKQIIEKHQIFECQLCGIWYCYICKQSHKHFSCKQWQEKLKNGELSRLGIKKCKCASILKKDQKQKKVFCKSCQNYFCWNCLKGWKNSKDCDNHIRECRK